MLRSIQIKNFKAIADSGRIELTPLTVFVGHNGTGKSSVLEVLEFFHRYVHGGVDEAVAPWYDLDPVLWQRHDREKPHKGEDDRPQAGSISHGSDWPLAAGVRETRDQQTGGTERTR